MLTGISKNILTIGLMIGFSFDVVRENPVPGLLRSELPRASIGPSRSENGSRVPGGAGVSLLPCSYAKERLYTGHPMSRSVSISITAGLKIPRRAVTELMAQDLQASGY